jgi:hypothetical protein
MFVTGNLHTLLDHGIIEELISWLLPALQYLLDNMITIDILTHFFDPIHKVTLNQYKVIINLCHLNQFLDTSSSMSILAQSNWFIAHLLYDLGELFVVTVVSQLLDQVVAETVVH